MVVTFGNVNPDWPHPCSAETALLQQGTSPKGSTLGRACRIRRPRLRGLGSSCGAVSVGTDETDETREGDLANTVQRVVVLLKQDHFLVASGPDRLHEAAVGCELLHERRGHLGEGGRDDDAVERCLFG